MSEWISVKDRMPEGSTSVIVAYESDADGEPCLDVGEGWRQVDGQWYGMGIFYRPRSDDGFTFRPDISKKKVTHWMPLPEPPEADND